MPTCFGIAQVTTATSGKGTNTLRNQGRLPESEKLRADMLAVQRRVLGPEHPDTLASMNNLADALGEEGRLPEAEQLLREALDLRRKVLGPDYSETLRTAYNLADYLGLDNHLEEAEKLQRETLALRLLHSLVRCRCCHYAGSCRGSKTSRCPDRLSRSSPFRRKAMTSTTLEGMSRAISTTAARLATGAIVSYQVLLVVLIFLRPGLEPSWHTISAWAIGPYGWIMSGGFLLAALSYAALFVMLKSQLQGTMVRIGLGMLLICVIGAAGVGLFTTDPMPLHFPLSKIGTLHVIFGTSQLVLFPFAALLINLSLARKNIEWARARRVLLWTAGLPLFGFVPFVLYSIIFVFPLGPQAYGHDVNIGRPPRFAFFTYMLWLVTLGCQAIKCGRQVRLEAQTKG